jgi:exosortase N
MKHMKKYGQFVLPCLIVFCSIYFLKDYFFPQFQIILALIVAPFVFRIQEQFVYSNRYFYVSIFCVVAYYCLYMKLFLFLALGTFLFYSIESRFGKIGALPFIFLICISPALHYLVNVFTFTLRLALSHYAAELLNSIGYPVQCHGNYFTLSNDFTFNVDKACLGLNMFNTGLALTTLMVGFTEKRWMKSLSFIQLIGIFTTACCLLVATNFLRILMIVFFKSLPGTTSHELIGVFSMITYMAFPVYLLINYLVKRFGGEQVIRSTKAFPSFSKHSIISIMMFAGLFFSFKSVEQNSKTLVRDFKIEKLNLNGFIKVKKQDGVMEFRSDSLLVYIKPAVKVFESDHPPALCWKGSGFDVEQISEVNVNNTIILMATIKKGVNIQYTAWWYDNGKIKTTNQWLWRFSKGEPFRIINLTSNNKTQLMINCNEFLKKRLF